MANIKGRKVSVTATAAAVVFADAMRAYTLTNLDTANSIWYRTATNAQDTFAGIASVLDALLGSEIKPGESVVLDPPVTALNVVCATGLTAALRVMAGRLVSLETDPATEAKQDDIIALIDSNATVLEIWSATVPAAANTLAALKTAVLNTSTKEFLLIPEDASEIIRMKGAAGADGTSPRILGNGMAGLSLSVTTALIGSSTFYGDTGTAVLTVIELG